MISAQVLPTNFGGVAGAGTLLSLVILVVLGRVKGQLKFWWTRSEEQVPPPHAKCLETETAQPQLYRVWGEDKVLHGPLDLATLKAWIKAKRVRPGSWVLLEDRDLWHRADDVPELKIALAALAPRSSPRSQATASELVPGFTSAALRRIKLFESLQEPQLKAFSQYLEVLRCRQFAHIIRQGERGEAMYLVLQGEVRAFSLVEDKESLLATFPAGQWFGELSVLDQGPRSVDVIANKDSVLLKLSRESFERLHREAPTLAIEFLLVLARTLAGRIRRTNKRYEDSIRFIRLSGIVD